MPVNAGLNISAATMASTTATSETTSLTKPLKSPKIRPSAMGIKINKSNVFINFEFY